MGRCPSRWAVWETLLAPSGGLEGATGLLWQQWGLGVGATTGGGAGAGLVVVGRLLLPPQLVTAPPVLDWCVVGEVCRGPSGDRSLGQVSENSTHVRAICCSGDMLAGCCVAAVLSRVFPGSRRALSGVLYIFAGMSWLLL